MSTPRRRLSVDDRRQELLRAGIALFADQAYDGLSIDDIAAHAGVSKGLLYHYFGGKRDFHLAVVTLAGAELAEACLPGEATPTGERLLLGLDGYLGYVEQHAVGFLALLRGAAGSDPQVQAVVEAVRAAVAERVLADLGVDGTTAGVRVAVRGWIGFTEAASLEWLASGRPMTRELLRWQCARALVDALASAALADPQVHLPEPEAPLLVLLERPPH